jgi:glutathione S-transferase
MSEPEIIGIPLSNYVRSLRMLCEEKGVRYVLTPLPPHAPEVKAIHPAGQIPCFRHDGLTLFETAAIAAYIDKSFGGPRLIPADIAGEAKVTQWVSYGNVKVDRWIMREYVVPSIFFDKAKGPDTAKIAAALPEIEACAAALDAALAPIGHLVGDGLTYADLHITPMLAFGGMFPPVKAIFDRHPALSAFIAAMTARESFTGTAPPPRK